MLVRIATSVLLVALSSIAAQPTLAQPMSLPAPLQHVSGGETARVLAEMLAGDFVLPDVAARYAAMLRANAAAGHYDALSGHALALRLSSDLQAVARDGHLRVRFDGPLPREAEPHGAVSGSAGGSRVVTRRAPDVPFVEPAQWIAPGIAFIRFNLFPGVEETVTAARQFMDMHADARAIIFDVRTHRGGGLTEMDEIFPWLFAEPTHLIDMATRRSVEERMGSPVADVPTLRLVEGTPQETVRQHWVTPNRDSRAHDAQLFVLTSPRTGSAAEHFVMALQRTGRATVVGAATAGANHFGGEVPLPGGFFAFIPVGRAYDPVTGRDWEGAGVAPDIATPPEQALVRVLTDLGVSNEEAQRLSDSVAPMESMAQFPAR